MRKGIGRVYRQKHLQCANYFLSGGGVDQLVNLLIQRFRRLPNNPMFLTVRPTIIFHHLPPCFCFFVLTIC
nr:hypothetical protein [uncultured bacterium]